MSTLLVLSYVGPSLGILGFIITPGLTVIYPWLREKFNAERRKETEEALARGYDHINISKVLGETHNFLKKYKWDWRPRIVRKKKELRKLREAKSEIISKFLFSPISFLR